MAINHLLRCLPQTLHSYLSKETEELRFRRNQPVIVLQSNRETVTSLVADTLLLEDLLDKLTNGSVSTFFDSITEGFFTVEGGHRVGVCGTAVYQGGALSHVKDISSVNIRIARERHGTASRLTFLLQGKTPLPGVLIISPPGCGKTTLLREITRQISKNRTGIRISVIDERGEISATYLGEAQVDLGCRCDILNGYAKGDAIPRAIRSLSPDVIIVDEIGSRDDEEGLLAAIHAGITVIATIHGDRNGDFKKKIRRLVREGAFRYYVYLSKEIPGDRIECITEITEGDYVEYKRYVADCNRRLDADSLLSEKVENSLNGVGADA